MTKRLEILKNSLTKKEQELQEKFKAHFETIAEANGQPLNDKRNGQATLNKWEKQRQAIRNLQKSIQKTKDAIQFEEGKIMNIEASKNYVPKEILDLVESGQLTQWRKYPHTFFVVGIDKARIFWDKEKKKVYHKFASEIKDKEQNAKFYAIYKSLSDVLNLPN